MFRFFWLQSEGKLSATIPPDRKTVHLKHTPFLFFEVACVNMMEVRRSQYVEVLLSRLFDLVILT